MNEFLIESECGETVFACGECTRDEAVELAAMFARSRGERVAVIGGDLATPTWVQPR